MEFQGGPALGKDGGRGRKLSWDCPWGLLTANKAHLAPLYLEYEYVGRRMHHIFNNHLENRWHHGLLKTQLIQYMR